MKKRVIARTDEMIKTIVNSYRGTSVTELKSKIKLTRINSKMALMIRDDAIMTII